MSEVEERAYATLARVGEVLATQRPETEHEWAMRAPTEADAIARWIHEAPPIRERAPAVPPPVPLPAPLADNANVLRLEARVAELEQKLLVATSRKGRWARRKGHGYLSADHDNARHG